MISSIFIDFKKILSLQVNKYFTHKHFIEFEICWSYLKIWNVNVNLPIPGPGLSCWSIIIEMETFEYYMFMFMRAYVRRFLKFMEIFQNNAILSLNHHHSKMNSNALRLKALLWNIETSLIARAFPPTNVNLVFFYFVHQQE